MVLRACATRLAGRWWSNNTDDLPGRRVRPDKNRPDVCATSRHRLGKFPSEILPLRELNVLKIQGESRHNHREEGLKLVDDSIQFLEWVAPSGRAAGEGS
jgi:hypothetical protein